MTTEFLLDWAIMSLSLFNTILLTWLGLTVLLNAERRAWPIVLAGSGLLMGAVFFISHSAILGRGLQDISVGMNFWWYVGWLPLIFLPFAWYMMILWYAGFWNSDEDKQKQLILRRRQRGWLFLTVSLAVALVGLFVFANPLPSYTEVAKLNLEKLPSIGSVPLLGIVYPLYIIICISLSLNALRSPGSSERVMGTLARRRARPWLVATSIVLLMVSLLVSIAVVWIITIARQSSLLNLSTGLLYTIGWFDFIISVLIATVVVLLGQAIVSYEVFTGKILPRRGLMRYWSNAVILAGGFSVVLGWCITIEFRPIYSLLLTSLIMAIFYALFSWRSYVEREQYMRQLRPFVASQRLYDYLITASSPSESLVVKTPFHALCEDVLGVKVAYLVALGSLSPLVGTPLAYPALPRRPLPPLNELTMTFHSAETICVPIEPNVYAGAMWAVPLWSERGLIGVLLLGEKRDSSLYTQEEIEIARSSGERLIDTQASAEMSQRLMSLQRQRLAESQIVDRRTRRVLHDDVLPRLHTAMLTMSGQPASTQSNELINMLADLHRQIANLLREMPNSAAPELARLGFVGALQQLLDRELGQAFDEVSWEVSPHALEATQNISSLTAEVLFYAAREVIRNAARYSRHPDRPLKLCIAVRATNLLEVMMEDNGVGLGKSQVASSGSGQGLALHSTMMAVVGGSLTTESMPDQFTRISLILPQAIKHLALP